MMTRMRFSDLAADIEGFHGERISVIRIRGRAFTSDDANLHPEIARVFRYMREHGVTKEVLDYLKKLSKALAPN